MPEVMLEVVPHKEPWKTNPAYKTRPNSPLKRAKRASPVWTMIKRLADDHPKYKEDTPTRASKLAVAAF